MTSKYSCLRFLTLSCFVLLGLSGLIVCATASYFINQILNYDYHDNELENTQGPPAILLAMGLLTSAFAIYFWFIIDHKYNCGQFVMITLLLIIMTLIETSMGIWALTLHENIAALLSTSLEESFITPQINYNISLLNVTILKFNCCNFNETLLDMNILSSHHCCNFGKMDEETRIMCNYVHGRECRHLTINKSCLILHRTFLLTLCSVFLQILVITNVIYYAKFLRKQKLSHRQSLVLAKPSAPDAFT